MFSNYVVERKRIDDLVKSVFDKRLFDQIRRASEKYEKIFVIIEGSPEKIKESTERWRAIYGALAYLAIHSSISVLYTSDPEETAYLIYSIASRINRKNRSENIVLRGSKKPNTLNIRKWQEYIVQCLPHVGPKLSQRLLATFGSVQRIFNASPSELSRVEGLSEEAAQEIVRIIRSSYNPRSEDHNKTLF